MAKHRRYGRLGFLACCCIVPPTLGQILKGVTRESAVVERSVADPDLGDEAGPIAPSTVAGSSDADCNVVGEFLLPFEGTSRYRGNVYRIETGALLEQIKMELAFEGTTDLVVAIHRKEVDGLYHRHLELEDDIVIAGALGEGEFSPAIYRTPVLDPPITLEAGFDYAIGFAWGARNVVYGRDDQGYPVNFEIGKVLGLVAVNGLPTTGELLPEVLPPLQIFQGGAYSMQLCFKPVKGACCLASNEQCIEVLESECTGAGSFFHGERTLCAETICQFGACCFACGGCLGTHTFESCALGNVFLGPGIAHWSGADCSPQLCPVVTGACCTGTACVDTKCETDCLAGGGTYRGDGTDCTPNMCQGACCLPSSCQNRTQATCVAPNVFKGEGTTCLTLPLDGGCPGACCRGYDITELDSCAIEQKALCASTDPGSPSAYRGDGSTCPVDCNDRVYGACCLPDGTCINTSSGFCNALWIQGEFNISVQCETSLSLCPSRLSRCCFSDGTCELLTQKGCLAFGGSRTLETTCTVSACLGSIPTGACCGANAACTPSVRQANCEASGGHYQGNNAPCPPTSCPGFGACCRDNGDCFDDLSLAQCGAISGEYRNNGSVCSPAVDCDQRGACCATSGFCLQATEPECGVIGGEFRSVGVACGADTCPAGACCLGDDGQECATRTAAGCAAEIGAYQGDDVSCSPDPCATGACCNGNECGIQTEADCLAAGYVFLDAGEDCTPTSCVRGACCNSDCTCQDDVRESSCVGSGKTFRAGEACVAGNCIPAIINSNPPNCAIDARQPHLPANAATLQGWKTFELIFSCGAAGTTVTDFAVAVEPDATPPSIVQATVSVNTVTLTLNRPIDPRAWTCFTHTETSNRICFGALPADANATRTADTVDVQTMLDNLADVLPARLQPWQCDLDHSAQCSPADVLTAVDLFNGAGEFIPWLDETIVSCPTGPAP